MTVASPVLRVLNGRLAGTEKALPATGAIAATVPAHLPWVVLGLVTLFVFFKQSGTVNWVLVSEIFPARIRGTADACGIQHDQKGASVGHGDTSLRIKGPGPGPSPIR